jgi:hypothetical protein
MAEVEFVDFLRVGLRDMLKKRADEIVRAGFSKRFYRATESDLRPQSEIDEFMKKLNMAIEPIVEEYILQLREADILSPEGIKRNPKKVGEITKRMENELKKRMEL